MANYLITGYWGEPHVTAENDRGIHAGIFGSGRFVLPVGEQFNAEYIGNNTIRMYDGKLMDNGAAAGIPVGEYIDLLITNASQGMKRNDLIVFQYQQDPSTLIETGSFVVIQGTETSGTPADPALSQDDLLSGNATLDQMALWRVAVNGTTISAPVKVFELAQTISNITPDGIGAAKKNHTHTAAQVGALPASTVIPDKVSMLENDSGFGYAENFSETEQLTGGTWFDGKPIYRISKYYSGVTFAGTGQWTTIGEAPIDLFSTAYNIIDSNVRLMIGGFSSAQSNCIGVDLPIVYNGGVLSTTWATDDNKLTFNWANSVTAPFSTANVLVVMYYTKND